MWDMNSVLKLGVTYFVLKLGETHGGRGQTHHPLFYTKIPRITLGIYFS